MRITKTFFLVFFTFSLILPLSLSYLGIKQPKLEGVTKAKKKISLNYHNLLNGTYQKKTEQSFGRNLAVFGPLVKADNQLSLWLFRQISSNPKSKVILGNNRHLIERSYLNTFNRETSTKISRLNSAASQLKKLQELLHKKGKSLEILISTNKPSYYPELVPDKYTVKSARLQPAVSETFIKIMRDKGLNPLDSKEYLKGIEHQIDYPMFAPTGTHWNQFASCKIVSELMSRIGSEFPQLECTVKGDRKKPTDQDMDLLKITNLLFPEALIKPAPLVTFKVNKSDKRPKILLIGTSFSGELMGIFNKNPQLADREFLYYYKRQILPSAGSSKPFDSKHFDALAAIERSDAIILEVNESSVQRIGYGFIQATLKSMK